MVTMNVLNILVRPVESVNGNTSMLINFQVQRIGIVCTVAVEQLNLSDFSISLERQYKAVLRSLASCSCTPNNKHNVEDRVIDRSRCRIVRALL